jgi:pimeloyl-ACP methyl ester carboxylesterase
VETQFLAIPGGRIAYDDTGTGGRMVVCVPGLGDSRRSYRFLRPRLGRAGYRVVTVDLRGHGESSVPWRDYTQTAVGLDLVDLVKHLDAGPAVLVGNSYAAGAVVWAAAQDPARVAGIVAVGGFLRKPEVTATGRLIGLTCAVSARAWGAYYGYAHRSAKPADLAPYRAGLAAMLREPCRREAMAAMMRSQTREGQRWAGAVNCPAVVVMGSQDPHFPDPAAEAASQAGLLRCPACLIDGAGHYPQSEVPGRTAEVLLPFLDRVLGTPARPETR